MPRLCCWLFVGIVFCGVSPLFAQDSVDLYGVREEHTMIPMRDGAKLSAYLYFCYICSFCNISLSSIFTIMNT